MRSEGIDKRLLKDLGLTNNEVEVYLKLLMSGSVTVNIIAERTGLHRQACYDALDRLLEKGFVNFVLKDSKKHFQALPPEQILVYVDQMKNRISEMMPELKHLAKIPKERSLVEVYKGKNVVRIIHRDVIQTLRERGGEIYITGVEEDEFIKYDKTSTEKYILDMRKFDLKEKLLAREGSKTLFPGSQSEYRLLQDKFFNPNPTYIYGDKVVFLVWGTPLYAVMIRNSKISDMNKKQFKMLWKIARKPTEKEKKSRYYKGL